MSVDLYTDAGVSKGLATWAVWPIQVRAGAGGPAGAMAGSGGTQAPGAGGGATNGT